MLGIFARYLRLTVSCIIGMPRTRALTRLRVCVHLISVEEYSVKSILERTAWKEKCVAFLSNVTFLNVLRFLRDADGHCKLFS